MNSGRGLAGAIETGTLEAVLAAIVESSEDVIVGKTLDGIIVSWNPAAEKLFGYAPSEAIGKPISLIIPDERLEDMHNILSAVGRGERVEHFETQRRAKDGRILDVSITVSPIRNAEGVVIGASKIGRDITARKREQRELKRRADQIEALYEAGRTLGVTLEPKRIYESLISVVRRVMKCDALFVSSYSADEKVIRAKFAWLEGNVTDAAAFPPVPLAPEGKGFQSTVIRTGKPLMVNDVESQLRTHSVTHYRIDPDGTIADQPDPKKPQTQSMIMVPIVLEAEVIGVVQVSSHDMNAYAQDDLELLEGLAYQMAAALRNAELYQRARESEAQFRLLANAMPQIAWSLDCHGHMDFLNARYSDYSGLTFDAPPEDTWTQIVHPDDLAPARSEYQRCVNDGTIWEQELRLRRRDGEYRWHLSRLVPVFEDGRVTRWFGTSTDIHEKKEAEELARREGEALKASREELRRLNAELEQRVDQRTAELTAANQEMEGFTYSVSHDLRAPLRAIMSSSMIVLEDFGETLPEEAREHLNRQALAAKKLASLIDDLLQYSRLGRKALDKQPVDLSDIAIAITEDLGRRHDTRRFKWKVQPGLQVTGDPNLIAMLLQNVLENAVKFTAGREVATIEVGKDDKGFFVSDNGVGFDMAYAHKLFRPFERLHRESDYAGTGIGLANVKRIVERHGGTVWADAEPEKGATFHFTLP